MAFRARVKGWNLPSTARLTEGGGQDVPQGVFPTIDGPQSFNLEVASAEGPGGKDFFEFDIHSPETLQNLVESRRAVLGRGIVVVVGDYDPERVTEAMRPLVESVQADTWEEVAFRVASLGPWEFEGWKWYPDEERLRPDPGVAAEVRGVRLLRTAIGDSFSLPIEVRFGANSVAQEVAVPLSLQSPLWIRNHPPEDGVVLGAGRVFSLQPDAEAILSALVETSPIARAPSWELLHLALRPLEAPGT
jgi:immunity protein 8 of polymorphic toxin system